MITEYNNQYDRQPLKRSSVIHLLVFTALCDPLPLSMSRTSWSPPKNITEVMVYQRFSDAKPVTAVCHTHSLIPSWIAHSGGSWHFWGHLGSLRRGKELANIQGETEACQQPHHGSSASVKSWIDCKLGEQLDYNFVRKLEPDTPS